MKKFLLFVTLLFTSHLACGAVLNEKYIKELLTKIAELTTNQERNQMLSTQQMPLDAIIETKLDNQQETLFHKVVYAKKDTCITWIFSKIENDTKNRLVLMQDTFQNTALHLMLYHMQKSAHLATELDIIKLIFLNISDETKNELILMQNIQKNTILHLACIKGQTDIARYILTQITDTETKQKLLKLRNDQSKTAFDIANDRTDDTGSALMALLQAEKQNTHPFANFILSNKPEHQQQRRRTGHGIALVAALVTAYDYFQYNKQKTKKQNTAQEKTEKNKSLPKKNLKQTSEQKEIIATETKTGFKAYLKALYAKPMKHKKAFAGLIGALAAEYFALTQ